MEYYLTLAINTFIIVILAILIWRKTKDVSFLIGIGLIYYFSLLGGWFIVYDNLTGGKGAEFGLHYYYLFRKLFPIYLDDEYFLTIIFYSLFIIIIELTVLQGVKRRKSELKYLPPLQISHLYLILSTTVCLLISLLIIKSHVLEASIFGRSVYTIISSSESRFFTIHQLLNCAVIPLILGFVICFSGKRGRFIIGKHNIFALSIYLILLSLWLAYFVVTGDKKVLFSGLIIGFLFYLVNTPHPNMGLFLIGSIATIISLSSIDMLRGFYLPAYRYNVHIKEILLTSYSIFLSNEMMASHFSMYGVLYYDVPYVWGYSIVSLFASILPRIFWSSRPPDIYPYYADYVGATPGQGYTIHHATGWYLNFGFLGIVVGAIIFGMVWRWCFNKFVRPKIKGSLLFSIFGILAPWLFVGGIPPLIRVGIEGYKGLVFDIFLVPTVIVTISCCKIGWKHVRGEKEFGNN